jgi:hypothetical protein
VFHDRRQKERACVWFLLWLINQRQKTTITTTKRSPHIMDEKKGQIWNLTREILGKARQIEALIVDERNTLWRHREPNYDTEVHSMYLDEAVASLGTHTAGFQKAIAQILGELLLSEHLLPPATEEPDKNTTKQERKREIIG